MPRGREVLDLLAAAVSNLSIATRSGRYWALRAAGREPRIDRVVAWPPVFDWLHRLPIVMRGPVRTMLRRRRLMRWSVRTRARLTDRGRRLFLGMNADHLGSAQVTQDVLLMCGEHDSFQPPSPTRAQAKALTAARSVTVRMFTKPRTLINAGGVRQAIARCTRAGLTVTCHRVADLDDHTRELSRSRPTNGETAPSNAASPWPWTAADHPRTAAPSSQCPPTATASYVDCCTSCLGGTTACGWT